MKITKTIIIAFICALSLLGISLVRYIKKSQLIILSAKITAEHYSIMDGVNVILEPNSKLQYNKKSDNELNIIGEISFNTPENRDLYIRTGNVKIKASGSFTINTLDYKYIKAEVDSGNVVFITDIDEIKIDSGIIIYDKDTNSISIKDK